MSEICSKLRTRNVARFQSVGMLPLVVGHHGQLQNGREIAHQTLRVFAQHKKRVYRRRTLRVNTQQRLRVNHR